MTTPSTDDAPRPPRRPAHRSSPDPSTEERAVAEEDDRPSEEAAGAASRERAQEALQAVPGNARSGSVPRPDAPHTRLLTVDFRNGEAVRTHPEVASHLDDGWHVQSAAPRVTDDGTCLLVVLTRFPPVNRSVNRR